MVSSSAHFLLLLPSIFPNTSAFSNELALCFRWPYWTFSFGISLSSEYSGLISFMINWFYFLVSKELSRIFSSATFQKHQFFGSQPSLSSNTHIHTWPLEKPQLWLYGQFVSNVMSLLFIYLFFSLNCLLSFFFPLIFSFIFISWRLITLQYCSGFCHTLTRISNGFTCVPHPDPPSRHPPQPIFIAFFPRASIF